MPEHDQRHSVRGRIPFFSRVFAAGMAAVALGLINIALPQAAQSQINGRVTSPPTFLSSAAVDVTRARLPKAPVQAEMPPPPPMRYMPGLAEPLVATGPVTDQEGKDLDAALQQFHDAPAKAGPTGDYDDYAKPLVAFIDAHPTSNWNAALYTDIGFGYYHAGYFSRAFTAFEKAWQLGRNATSPQAHFMIDRAVGELARMHARVGHAEELEVLFKDIGNRPIGGPATETLAGAHDGLSVFRDRPDIGYLCGPMALKNVLIKLKADKKQIQVADDARSGRHGFSLEQLAALAGKAGLKYELIYRKPGQPVPVPSIVNWGVHHYAAVTEKRDGVYYMADPTFADAGARITAKAIDSESSGYFLVPLKVAAANPGNGWRKVSAHSQEARSVYGMGQTGGIRSGAQAFSDYCIICSLKKAISWVFDDAPQMTVANASMMEANLKLTDQPVGYRPQIGIANMDRITYNARDDVQPANMTFSNLSSKWTHSWQVYIQDDPNGAVTPTRFASGGGGFDYYTGLCGLAGGACENEPRYTSVLTRVPATGTPTSWTYAMPDGSIETFGRSNNATTYPRILFLTQVKDPQGNFTTINYDATLRITSVVDAMGRSTTFTYGLAGYPLLITQITDPFGRTTQFTYDGMQRLASITDPIGITSSFTYSATETTFVNTLTTPYGTSKFSDTPNPHDIAQGSPVRSLTLTDPLGYTDYDFMFSIPGGFPPNVPASQVPVGMTHVLNNYLQYRNTFYWNKHAFVSSGITLNSSGNPTGSEDFYHSPLLYHWSHDSENTNLTSGYVSSIKQPLEQNRVWFYNAGSVLGDADYSGTIFPPSQSGRVLDDGTSQISTSQYFQHSYQNVTYEYSPWPSFTFDPLNRETKYTYASNYIDLLTVQQLTAPSTFTTIATYGPYTAHEPSSYTGADGQTWNYTYNSAGQLKTVTDPNSGVTTFNYDNTVATGVGRLINVVDANLVTVLTLTYDSADRVLTRTDSEGYVLTYGYDNLDRITSITYPDGTTDLYDYTFQSGPLVGTPSLELRKHTDRLARMTTYGYDADQRLTSVTEPTTGTATRTTNYDYYEDGTLKDIIDANGNDTHWDIDVESRPIDKIYAYGTPSAQTETYAYENSTSRLHSVTDALGQVKTFTYAKDDRITGITYTNTVNATPNVSFTWDPYFPRLTSMTDGLGTTSYAYTPIGSLGGLKLASVQGPFTDVPANNLVGLTYDALGRLAGRTMAGGNESFGYDAISRLNSHTTPLGNFTYGYLGETDQTASRSVTNGGTTVSTNWGYDTNTNDRRLIGITNSGVTRSFALSYLIGGTTNNPYDVKSITDTAAAGHPWATQSRAYGYDKVDRLLTATSTTPGNDAYGYDKLDNATTYTLPSGSVSPTYNALNQVSTWGTKTYAYDLDGNLLSGDGARTYKWDAENRLIEIDYVGSTSKNQFSYDGMGHRMVDVHTPSSGSPTTTRYMWCGSSICQDRDGSDNVLRRDLDEGEYNAATSQKLVYMPDQLGSVRDVLDATTGSLVQSYDYTPYGATARTSGTTPTDYQYAGLFRHTPSNLNLSATRPQDGGTGRWIGRDPIRELGGINLYGYVGAGPTNFIDSLGLIVQFVGSPDNIARLKKAYAEVQGTPRGCELSHFLEDSETLYTVSAPDETQLPGESFYDPDTHTITIDPVFLEVFETTDGLQLGPLSAELGHEMGHAATGTNDDGPGQMNNVNQNENPIRKSLGLPLRIKY